MARMLSVTQWENSPRSALSFSPHLTAFSYLHRCPPQKSEHCREPDEMRLSFSETREYEGVMETYLCFCLCTYQYYAPLPPVRAEGGQHRGFDQRGMKGAAPIVGHLITSEDTLTVCVKSPVIPHLLQGDLIIGYVPYI